MDAFYASIEQRDNDYYRGKPLAVGYSGARGVVAAASYEARRYGVRSAMSSKVALRKCPHLIFVSPRFDVYKSVSNQIMNIFYEYTDLVEPLSLDEAFLDVTENKMGIASATTIAEYIRLKIYEQTNLTASAGVSYNKFLAKIASDYKKPNGLFVIKPQQGEQFVEALDIERFFGVGKVTTKHMHDLGIKTGFDLKQVSLQTLINKFGKLGYIYYQNARGIDDREVEPHRERKSIGSEVTFERDIDNIDELCFEMQAIAKELAERISEKKFEGRTVTLKIKYADFKNKTRSKTFIKPIIDYQELLEIGYDLLQTVDLDPKVRLIGLSVKNIDESITHGGALQLRIQFEDED